MLYWRTLPFLVILACGPGSPNTGDTTSAGSSGGVATTGGLAGSGTTSGAITTSTGSLPTTSGAPTTGSPGDATSTTVPDMTDTTVAAGSTSATTGAAGSTSTTTDPASSSSDSADIDFDCMTGSDDSTTDDPQPCACTPADPVVQTPLCGDQLCDTVVADEGYVLANPDALMCALKALRDRTPGYLKWAWNEGGMYSRLGYVLILPDHTAIYRVWGTEDEDFIVDPEHVLIADPCVFDQCLEVASFNCLGKLPRTHLAWCR